MSASAINQADEGKIVELRRQIEAKVEEERQLYENEFEEETELSSLDILEGLRANEDGDGQLFSYLNRDRFSYDHKRGLWHMWKGHYWSEDEINNSLAAVETVVDVYAEEAERQAQTKINETKAGNNESAKKAEHLEKEAAATDSNSSNRSQKEKCIDTGIIWGPIARHIRRSVGCRPIFTRMQKCCDRSQDWYSATRKTFRLY